MKKIAFFLIFLPIFAFGQFPQKYLNEQDSVFAENLWDYYLNTDDFTSDSLIFYINKYLGKKPCSAKTLALLSNIFYNLGEYELSISTAKKSIKCNPNLNEPYLILVKNYFYFSIYDSALYILNNLIKKHPNDPAYYVLMGVGYYLADKSKDSLNKYFNLAEKINPKKRYEAYYYIAEFYKGLENYDSLYKYIKLALKDTITEDYLVLKEVAEYKLSKFYDALNTVNQLIDLNPDNPTYFKDKIIILITVNRYEDAIDISNLALEKFNLPVFYKLLSAIYDEIQDYDKYVYINKKGIENFPDTSDFYDNLIDYYSLTKNYDSAIYYCDLAIKNLNLFTYYGFKKSSFIIYKNTDEKLLDDSLKMKNFYFSNLEENQKLAKKSYKKLLKKYYQTPYSLSLDEFYLLYLGMTQQKNYDVQEFENYYYKILVSAEDDVQKALELLRETEKKYPLMLSVQNLYGNLRYYIDSTEFMNHIFKFAGIYMAITSTGDGLSPNTAYISASSKDDQIIVSMTYHQSADDYQVKLINSKLFNVYSLSDEEQEFDIYFYAGLYVNKNIFK